VDLAIRWRARRRAEPGARRSPLAAVAAVMAVVMLAVVMVNWVPDFRYYSSARHAYATGQWDPIVNNFRRECKASPNGVIEAWVMDAIPKAMPIPCDRLRY
jgi:alkylated DNA repair dioxygenase AlkB